jgi:hypothetical protein
MFGGLAASAKNENAWQKNEMSFLQPFNYQHVPEDVFCIFEENIRMGIW